MYTLQQWLHLDSDEVANQVAQRISTAAVYLNGTRRWFLSRRKDWADYAKTTGQAQRALSQLFYAHGIQTLIQPLLGYDLLTRGPDYLKLAVEQGLAQLAAPNYKAWFHRNRIRVTFYGNWRQVLSEKGFPDVVEMLQEVITETAPYGKHSLLFGAFADEGLNRIITLSKDINQGDALLRNYYGQPVGPVELIIGSGQPVIWDLPLLDINQAHLYFLQAPTFCLDQPTLRKILYDYLYQRINDDALFDNLSAQTWQDFKVLGLGQKTDKGWTAL